MFDWKFVVVVLFRGYAARKSAFEHVQQIEYLEKKKRFEEDLCEELQDARKNIGDSNVTKRDCFEVWV